MLRTLSQRSVRQFVTLAKCDRVVIGRIDFGLRINTFRFAYPFSTEVANKTEEKKGILETDKGYTPEGAAFTNPNIASDWVYREEKDTKRQYYINTKTNEIVFNRTPDSALASRWRRIAAGSIDFAAALCMRVSFR